MATHIRLYNPIANQRIDKNKVNVIGRVVGAKMQHLSVFLNNFLIRRVRPTRNGAFECRINIEDLDMGEHAIEIRSHVGQNTERVMVNFKKIPPKDKNTPDQTV